MRNAPVRVKGVEWKNIYYSLRIKGQLILSGIILGISSLEIKGVRSPSKNLEPVLNGC